MISGSRSWAGRKPARDPGETGAPPESWASGSVRGVVFDDLGTRAPVAYWEQLGHHALACFQGRGQDLDSVLVPASLDPPLGCHQVDGREGPGRGGYRGSRV